jgi:hypothetical protein
MMISVKKLKRAAKISSEADVVSRINDICQLLGTHLSLLQLDLYKHLSKLQVVEDAL